MTEHVLTGLDGANPLAFLAALGTLRTATLALPRERVRLHWLAADTWHPVLTCDCELVADRLVDTLHVELARMAGHPALAVDDNLKLSQDEFRAYSMDAAEQAISVRDRRWADFAAAFGSDVIGDDDMIADTALRTMSGAGHQHFLKTMRDIVADTSPEQLHEAIFGPWRYRDVKLSLRWDPADDRRYALRWKEPSGDPAMTVRGANRLAIEGLPLLPCMPVRSRLETTGFRGVGARDTFWTWPIWCNPDGPCPLSLDAVRSVLSLSELQDSDSDIKREDLRRQGVAEVYRSQRLTIGKFRNFTPAKAV